MSCLKFPKKKKKFNIFVNTLHIFYDDSMYRVSIFVRYLLHEYNNDRNSNFNLFNASGFSLMFDNRSEIGIYFRLKFEH